LDLYWKLVVSYLFHISVEIVTESSHLFILSFDFQLEMIIQTSNYYSMQAAKKNKNMDKTAKLDCLTIPRWKP